MTPLTPEDFDDLVREHQAGLRAFIRALGTQDAWVDDLAQEAFLVAHRRLADFEPGADFGRWLRGIARNLVCNERRKTARRSRLLQDSISDVLWAGEDTEPVSEAPGDGVMRAMVECVAQLPTRSREMLERRYAGNSDAPALGVAFGLSAAAARQALVRARDMVRRCIVAKLGEDRL